MLGGGGGGGRWYLSGSGTHFFSGGLLMTGNGLNLVGSLSNLFTTSSISFQKAILPVGVSIPDLSNAALIPWNALLMSHMKFCLCLVKVSSRTAFSFDLKDRLWSLQGLLNVLTHKMLGSPWITAPGRTFLRCALLTSISPLTLSTSQLIIFPISLLTPNLKKFKSLRHDHSSFIINMAGKCTSSFRACISELYVLAYGDPTSGSAGG